MTIDEAIKQTENVISLSRMAVGDVFQANNDYWETVLNTLQEKQAADDNEPCDFCRSFDFSSARTQVDKYGARVSLALSTTRFDREEQFNYCPVCGRRRNE